MSTSFPVSRVLKADARMPEVSLSELYEARFGKQLAISHPDASVVEAYDGHVGNLVHGLLGAAHIAFDQHCPLVFSPDVLWITVVQGFAKHISLNPDEYRAKFANHEGKKRLEYWTEAFPGTDELPWPRVFEIFSDLVRKEIGDESHGLLSPNFSTTGPLEKIVSDIAVLDSMQSFFEYYGGIRCGIPSVTLEGTSEDWELFALKVAELKKFGGLDWWLDKVSIIAKEFVAASKGDVSTPFWQNLYKLRTESDGTFVDGWITHFIPYICQNVKNPTLSSERRGWGGGITFSSIPGSVSCVPMIWNYMGTEINYDILGGIIGVTQNQDTLALRPLLGWSLREQSAAPKRK